MRKVPFVDFSSQYSEEKVLLQQVVEKTCESGMYVGGPEIGIFEEKIAKYCGRRYAVALASGTSALTLALQALGVRPGDEVITAPNSFISTAATIASLGAIPVFADVGDDQNINPEFIEKVISPRTCGILPVHLTGRLADMPRIMDIAAHHGLWVIEDAAQSVGSSFCGTMAGTFGDIGCFSAHPLKNLNAIGDAGFVVLDDQENAERIRRLANNGFVDRNTCLEWGSVARMDSIQAAVLTMRLSNLHSVIQRRQSNASRYKDILNSEFIFVPGSREGYIDVHHTFVVQVDRRDELQARLETVGIGTAIHYPVPIHLQPAAAGLGYKLGDFPKVESQAGHILSLPIHQYLTDDDLHFVASEVNNLYS